MALVDGKVTEVLKVIFTYFYKLYGEWNYKGSQVAYIIYHMEKLTVMCKVNYVSKELKMLSYEHFLHFWVAIKGIPLNILYNVCILLASSDLCFNV